ncbi:septation protein A [Bordetella genomosp. 7]|uniref:Inner membrane-spanning protein YciB n=1 Tax=Bordetella genomosp. 7 TaxID=1416805 RepID=A0A261RKD8_9BORD|nr:MULTISPECIES: septation protein A [Bordetella]OZI24763.1 septation protein A [Bordetella genomosp. 7]OZI27800.1 septation protein A [Bordetella genomosp. 7]
MKKFLFDLFPLILFFIAYRFADIYAATAVAIAASVAQFIWLRATGKQIEATHWINLSVIVIFGGATLWLQSDVFIKWKPTVLYWLFGGALLGARLLFGRNLMQRLLGKQIELPAPAWEKLNLSWALFFLAAGAINLYVAFSGHFTESQWVNFKVFGLMGLLLVFVIGQSLWLGRHMQQPRQPGSGSDAGQD